MSCSRVGKLVLVVFSTLAALSAHAFDVTATMPNQTGGAAPTSCRLYLGGNVVSQVNTTPVGVGATPAVDKACGTAITYPNLVSTPGTYTFQHTRVNSAGESAKGPTTTVVIGQKPDDPTAPPVISVACTPAPCPASITIVITP